MDKRLEFNSMTLVELQELFLTLGEKNIEQSSFLDFFMHKKTLKLKT